MTTQTSPPPAGTASPGRSVPALPEPGQVVQVRGAVWAVTEVEAQGLLRSPADDGQARLEHVVALQSLDEDRMGEELRVVWELEVGNSVVPDRGLPDTISAEALDDPDTLGAFVDAVRWGAVTSADPRAFQSPFRSGATLEPYQLEPLRRALAAPRTNLLLADDVGLGKTIEAGLVIEELLLRHRARSVIIVCPPSLALKWRDEMREKFGLEFVIVDSARMAADPLTLAGEVFGPADWPLYEAGLRREQFGVDDATLAPYLELWNVVEKGVFYAANRLYGLTFHERADLAAHMYDPSVRVWEVRDGAAAGPGQEAPVLGLFVGDYFAREGKSGGAWMNSLVNQSHLRGTRPVVINCANVPVPQEGGPTLLTWDEVITCFHEFGHALHALLSDTYYPSASGANVPNDVVEFPSQVNESWALHPQVLASYAVHVDTGEPMPEELATRLRSQGSFGQGYATTEYLGAALLDQAWHTLAADQVPDDVAQVEVLERRALEESGIEVDLVPPRYRTTYFSHVFAGGYAAAYYAYIWSEVMDADTVAWFRADGQGGRDGDLGLNRQAGEAFRREFLSRGDSRDPLVSYRALTGRDPAIEPLLVRRGLA